ncbi:MAG TPA: DUF6655 family protein [Pirellulales bacterium]|nr:DUF6655 family protein [Pirellulales bacterium]
MRSSFLCTLLFIALAAGCGTTKWSDTPRTATEQLLLSTAVDRAIDNMDFKPLADRFVFLDAQYLDCVDKGYVVSTLRQHMLSEGCVMMPDAASADFVVEVRSGGVGTDHHDVLVGVPAISVPTGGIAGVPSIPEIPFAKTTSQRGVAKLACFAYNRETGQAVWQSGVFPIVSTAKDSWFLGTGPFQRGTIYDSTHFAGSRFLASRKNTQPELLRKAPTPVTAQAQFPFRPALVRKTNTNKTASKDTPSATVQASASSPAASVRGSSGPSLSSSTPATAAGGAPATANAGTSTGLPNGQVVQLPSIPQSTSGGSSSGSWLKLR